MNNKNLATKIKGEKNRERRTSATIFATSPCYLPPDSTHPQPLRPRYNTHRAHHTKISMHNHAGGRKSEFNRFDITTNSLHNLIVKKERPAAVIKISHSKNFVN